MVDKIDIDEVLLRQFADGDQHAFTVLYDRFYLRVLQFTRRYTNETDAQDITADTFVQLWRKRNQFSHLNAISSFLFITARNRCYDLIRHNRVKSRYADELVAMTTDRYDSEFFLTEVRLELARLVRQEIDKLPEGMRKVVMLSFKEGLKPAEIAKKLNISVKTVSNQKLSAIKLLKSALRGYPRELILLLLPQILSVLFDSFS